MDRETIEDRVGNLFSSGVSGTGEEELLRLASKFSKQYQTAQIRIILFLEHIANTYELLGEYGKAERITRFVTRYEDLMQYNGSEMFVMRALEAISLRKYINDSSLKINVEK